MDSNIKKAAQLGMPHGTASNRLRKMIIFSLLKKLNENYCHQCGGEIESVKELSIEHKIPWLDSANPKELFFDLDNIGFSHLSCNAGAARQTHRVKNHGETLYKEGCRCDICKSAHNEAWSKYKSKRKRKIQTPC